MFDSLFLFFLMGDAAWREKLTRVSWVMNVKTSFRAVFIKINKNCSTALLEDVSFYSL